MSQGVPGSDAPQRSSTLASRLLAARRRRFVGRTDERELFRGLLTDADPAFALVHVHGPGGIGKTTLLGEFASIATEVGATPVVLDARNLDPSPAGFVVALRLTLGLSESASVYEALSTFERPVLMIDTYETLLPLDGWLRESFLPQCPEATLVVIAGRNPPSGGWRSDPGWRDLVRVVALRNLRPDESRDYLLRRGIPEKQLEAVLGFTHGHPLALSLVADMMNQSANVPFNPQASPDVVGALLERFVQQVPSLKHREALETCVLVRVTTEANLRVGLGLDDANEYFDWLRGLSFVETGPLGLFPHDLARDALDADLRWRNPDWYGELHRRVRGYYTKKLTETRGLEQQRMLFDDVYLHRHNPMVKPFVEWGSYGTVFGESYRSQDQEAILEMVERHEGKESARWARFWLERQPQSVLIYRGLEGEPIGFLMALHLQQADPADLQADPATRAAWGYASRFGPPRPGEEVLMFRFWMDHQHYQAVSPTQVVIFLNMVQNYFAFPKLSWSFLPCADPEFWLPNLTYTDILRSPEGDYQIADTSFAMFTHDWRKRGVQAWLDLLGERELALDLKPEQMLAERPALVVLSQPEFEQAVRDALRDYTRPTALQSNPLLRSRLATEKTGGEATPATLQAIVKEAAEELRANSKDEKLYRALLRTYLDPAPTQEIAADLLDLPFSTYRRHLTSGVERVAEYLWQRELYGEEK
jgi:hypothetical protein